MEKLENASLAYMSIARKYAQKLARVEALSWKYLENRSKPIDAFTAKFSSIFQSTFVLTHITSHTICELHIARFNNKIIHTYIQTIMTKWISWGSSQLWRNSNSCNASLIISYTFPKRLSAPLGDLKRGQTWFEIPVVNLPDWNNFIFSPKNALFLGPLCFWVSLIVM